MTNQKTCRDLQQLGEKLVSFLPSLPETRKCLEELARIQEDLNKKANDALKIIENFLHKPREYDYGKYAPCGCDSCKQLRHIISDIEKI
jgi:hypothetical protein